MRHSVWRCAAGAARKPFAARFYCAAPPFLRLFFVRVKRLRKRTHAHLLRGVQVFACALCASCVPPYARACANSLRCASFCVCIVCLVVCGECLCKRPRAQMLCGVRILLLRGLLTGAPEAAPAGLGPDLVILLLRCLLAAASEVGI